MSGKLTWEDAIVDLLRERDELRAEVAQERNERDTTADLLREARAEVERLTKASRGDPLSTAQLRIKKQALEIERLRAVVEVAREVQRGSETWYVPGDILDRLNSTLAALDRH